MLLMDFQQVSILFYQTKSAANGFFHFEPYTVLALSIAASRLLLVALIRWMIGRLRWSSQWKKTSDCGGKINLTGNNKNWYWNIAKFITQNLDFHISVSPRIRKIALEGVLLKALILSFHFICTEIKRTQQKWMHPCAMSLQCLMILNCIALWNCNFRTLRGFLIMSNRKRVL